MIWGVKENNELSSKGVKFSSYSPSFSSIPNVKIHLVLIRVTVNSQFLLIYLDEQVGHQLSALAI